MNIYEIKNIFVYKIKNYDFYLFYILIYLFFIICLFINEYFVVVESKDNPIVQIKIAMEK